MLAFSFDSLDEGFDVHSVEEGVANAGSELPDGLFGFGGCVEQLEQDVGNDPRR